MVEGVTADTFTLFLHHNYGKRLEVYGTCDFQTLAELYTLANKFEDKEMLNKVVGRMLELVAEGGEVVFLSDLFEMVSTHHVAEVEDAVANKLNQVKVREEDFPALMQLACGGAGPRQKLLQHLLARFLGKHCPSSHQVFKHIIRFPKMLTGHHFVAQLALFLAAQPFLNSETVVAVLKLIPEPSQELPREEAEEEDAGVGRKEKFELERREPYL